MIDRTILPIQERTGHPSNTKKFRPLLDILLAALPIFVFGFIGTKLGADTMLGGALINLAYVFAIVVAGVILKARGTSWQENGLAWPQKWSRTF